jgi:hypothetical protein
MPRKTKSTVNEDLEIEQVLEMSKLERQTNEKRKILLKDNRMTKTEKKTNPWHCKKYARAAKKDVRINKRSVKKNQHILVNYVVY